MSEENYSIEKLFEEWVDILSDIHENPKLDSDLQLRKAFVTMKVLGIDLKIIDPYEEFPKNSW